MKGWFRATYARPAWVKEMWQRWTTKLEEWAERQNKWELLGFLCVVTAALVVLWMCLSAVRSNGAVDHCEVIVYTGEGQTTWKVISFRPWVSNTNLGFFPSYEEAVKAAERVQCPIR